MEGGIWSGIWARIWWHMAGFLVVSGGVTGRVSGGCLEGV